MEDKIDDQLTKYDDKLNNLIIDGLQPHFQDYQKVNLYNTSISIPLHKIWLKTPKLRLLKTPFINEKNKYPVSIEFLVYRQTPEQDEFLSFIEKIEKKARLIIKKQVSKQQKMRSIIRPLNDLCYIISMKCPIDTKRGGLSCGVYNNKNRLIDPTHELNSGVNIGSYIELTDIWVSEKEYGFNWNILQMKIYPEFNFSKCLFSSDPVFEDPEDFADIKIKPPNPPPLINKREPPPKVQTSSFIPSTDMLINMKKLLKKVPTEVPEEAGASEDGDKKEYRDNIEKDMNDDKEKNEEDNKDTQEDENRLLTPEEMMENLARIAKKR